MRRLVLLAFLAFIPLAHGGVYKWVDAQGKVHFSDSPPPGRSAQTVKIPPSNGVAAPAGKQPNLAEQEAAFNKRRMERAESEAKAQQADAKKQEMQQYCNNLKGRLAGLKSYNSRLIRYDEAGKRQVLGSADKQAEIKEVEQAIAQDCSG